ncbi:MAG: phosphoribosylamine--glycine ligase [Chloroflexi bacterium]|nr:phosphoribosylamine--glycine ligase [Chloroflexota bacterium]
MRVLVVGSGGREHALCWKIRQSPRCGALYAAPGNPGMAPLAEIVDIPAREVGRIADWADERRIDLVVVGPDDPLALGIVDELEARGVRVFGPTRAAAQIEWSKSWARRLCIEADVPVPDSGSFDDQSAAHRYVDSRPPGLVVKADGLAAGKGTTVCRTQMEAHAAIDRAMRGRAFGAAGAVIVIEEMLSGFEVSVSAICDGSTYRMLPYACDHKALCDGDRGPNTGGMGTHSPPAGLAPASEREIELRVVAPLVRAMARIGRPFRGFLYPGVFVTPSGVKVFEINARLGDPEAQVILPRLDGDLLELMGVATDGNLARVSPVLPLSDGAACCVVLASAGYPESAQSGIPISGDLTDRPSLLHFHAGTRAAGDGLATGGGRVLGVTGLGTDLAAARDRAYAGVAAVGFAGMQFRRDIGQR